MAYIDEEEGWWEYWPPTEVAEMNAVPAEVRRTCFSRKKASAAARRIFYCWFLLLALQVDGVLAMLHRRMSRRWAVDVCVVCRASDQHLSFYVTAWVGIITDGYA